ncbi:outer membrane beta-barrel protein [Magnetococcales bacterium HHB-1]
MNNLKKGLLLSTALLLGSTSLAMAADDTKKGFPLMGSKFRIYPKLKVTETHDDNLYSAETAESSSWITTVTPSLDLETFINKHKFVLGISGARGVYHSTNNDNYTDYGTTFDADLDVSKRLRFDFGAKYKHGHDARGSADNDTTDLAVPHEHDTWTINTKLTYGGTDAKGRLTLSGSMEDLEYTNHEATTDSLEKRKSEAEATFYWKVMPKTSLLVGYRLTDFDYDTNFTLDSIQSFSHAGVKWQATAKTSGTIKVGKLDKRFDYPAIHDSWDALGWEIDVSWNPTEKSSFDLNTSKGMDESTSTADLTSTDAISLSWKQYWTSKLSTKAKGKISQKSYEGAAQTRVDDVVQFDTNVTFKARNWLDVTLDYTFKDRNSNSADNDYTQNKIVMGLNSSF